METIINFLIAYTLFGSAIVFWVITVGLVITLITSEQVEDGFVAMWGVLIFITATYFWSNVNVLSLIDGWDVLIYLGLGLLYSIIRTFFYGKKEYRNFESDFKKDYHGKITKSELNDKYDSTKIKHLENLIDKLKGHVFRWWLLFPISLLTWILSDLVKDLFEYAYSKMSKTFNYILKLGFK